MLQPIKRYSHCAKFSNLETANKFIDYLFKHDVCITAQLSGIKEPVIRVKFNCKPEIYDSVVSGFRKKLEED